jgi:NACHT domain
MARDSQDQRVGDIDGRDAGVQIGQGGRDVINAQNSQVTKNAYYSLFGHRGAEANVDWDRAMQILRQEMLPEIKKRLKDSLFGWAEVDAVEVRTVRLEDSPSLALEAVKLLTVGGGVGEEIDPRMPIIQTYAREDVQGKLLILGTPGAGKTITLLKLAEQLVGEAIAQPQTVIPIIFELSTWKDGQDIEAWLIQQLYESYSAKPKRDRKQKLYEKWLERRVLLPLLDGLDELEMVRQQRCTAMLNEFARTYPQVVVCCRVKEFQQVGIDLANLRGKVELQPLTDEQIQNYLKALGKSELWQHIHKVPEMRQLLQPVVDIENPEYDEPGLLRVPLFIKLATESYTSDSKFSNKYELLESFIEYQISRDFRESERSRRALVKRSWAYKSINDEPHPYQTRRYIQWVAQKITAAEIIEFNLAWVRYGIRSDIKSPYINHRFIEMPWLDDDRQRSVYRLLYLFLIFLSTIILSIIYPYFAIDFCLVLIFNTVLFIPLCSAGILAGLCVNFLSNILLKKEASEVLRGLFNWIKWVFFCAARGIFKLSNSNYEISMLITFLMTFLIFGVFVLTIFQGVIEVLTMGGLAAKLIETTIKINPQFAIVLLGGLQIFPMTGLAYTIFGYSERKDTDEYIEDEYIEDEYIENENIELSLPGFFRKDKVVFMLILYSQLVYLLGLMTCSSLKINIPEISIFASLPTFLPMVVFFCLFNFFQIDIFDQIEFWQHLPRRFILYMYARVIPWNIARFLDYCTERRLLQRIGGRYRFIHRELLDHFAAMPDRPN